jgi:hypothetical protein
MIAMSSNLMMEMEDIFETLVFNSILIWLMIWEDSSAS